MALDHLENAGRQARFEIGFLELGGGERRQAGRLEDHRVAEGERGSRLPARDLQRVIPGADAGDDSERLAARITESLRAEVDVLAGRALCESGEILEAFRAGDDVDDARFLNRLAGIARLERGQFIVAGAQDLGGTPQYSRALRRPHRRPAGLGLAGSQHRRIDFLRASDVYVTEQLAGGGIQRGQAPAHGRGNPGMGP